jgi:CHAP domain
MLARQRALQIALAEAAKHLHEEGKDTGRRVKQYQAAAGGGTGWLWCEAFCDFCFAEAGRPLDELQRSARVDTTYNLAKQHGWVVPTPARGDLVCFQWDTGELDHIGCVIQPLADGTIKTVEGNTTGPHSHGVSDGVYVKIRPRSVCAHFIRVPGNVAAPEPPAGYEDWAKWVKGGRKGKRPAVAQQLPRAWWAKIGEELDPEHDPLRPHPRHVPSHAHA